MAQHPAVARFYDEHTEDLHNAENTKFQALAERMLKDGRELARAYEELQAEVRELRAVRLSGGGLPMLPRSCGCPWDAHPEQVNRLGKKRRGDGSVCVLGWPVRGQGRSE